MPSALASTAYVDFQRVSSKERLARLAGDRIEVVAVRRAFADAADQSTGFLAHEPSTFLLLGVGERK